MAGVHLFFRRASMAKAIVILASFALAGCTTISANNTASATQQRNEINAQANATLTKLYQAAPQTKSLVGQSKGILIFPSIVGASFIVGAEHGKGVLRQNDQPVAYYSTTSGSVGLQAGAQSRATVLLFMTDEALLNFKKSEGWTAGADAKVAVANIGADGSLDTNTIQQPIIGFSLTNAGLAAGVSLDGAKITRDDSL